MAPNTYRCSLCGVEFEGANTRAAASAPVTCPVDAGASLRVLRVPPAVLYGWATGDPWGAAQGGWSHFGHRHGPGVAPHSH